MKNILAFFLLLVSCKAVPQAVKVEMTGTIIQVNRPPSQAEDWSPIFQHEIDSCIANNIPEYVIPAGRWICRHPLIISKWSPAQGYYAAVSLRIRGYSTFAGADGSGTILDFTGTTEGFAIGIQGGKGVEIIGIKAIGGWNYSYPGDPVFYNAPLSTFTDGRCRDTRYSPYAALVIDPFGPSVPPDGGYTGLSAYYKGGSNGSTGTVIEDCYFTNWVIGLLCSPNGQTYNDELLVADKLQFGNMKIAIAGSQAQEKMNHVSNVMAWGVIHTIFALGLYGNQSVGQWNLDHFNIAGKTNQLIYSNEGGYGASFLSDIFAESIGRLGTWYSINGSKLTNAQLNFAGPDETGSYINDQYNGYGITVDGGYSRMYGWNLPVTIATGAGANDFHFKNHAFDVIPVYPQNYPYGNTTFENCNVGGRGSADKLNPSGGNPKGQYAYPATNSVAAHAVLLDNKTYHVSKKEFKIVSDSSFATGEVVVGTCDYVDYKVIGVCTGGNTISYPSQNMDTTRNYSLYHWKTNYR